jgi:hypothetical protein
VPPQNLVGRAIVDLSALGVKLAHPMLHLLYALLATVRSSLKPQRELALENLALRATRNASAGSWRFRTEFDDANLRSSDWSIASTEDERGSLVRV